MLGPHIRKSTALEELKKESLMGSENRVRGLCFYPHQDICCFFHNVLQSLSFETYFTR